MNALVLLLAVLLSASDSSEVTLTRTTIVVSDRAASLAFYRDTLGFTVIHEGPYSGTTFHGLFNLDPAADVYFVILRSRGQAGAMLGLLEIRDDEVTPTEHATSRTPRYGETILWFTTDNLDLDYQQLKEIDATIIAAPFDTRGGREMVAADPDGVRLYLFEKTPQPATP